MSVDVATVRVPLEFSYHEARALRSACRVKAKKFEHEAWRNPFVPAPGKIDKNAAGAQMMRALCERIDAALTAAIEGAKADGKRGDL